MTPGSEFWAGELPDVFARLCAGPHGLSTKEAQTRLSRAGLNRVVARRRGRGWRLLSAQFTSPVTLILVAATVLSMALGDLADGLIILVIVMAGGLLGFWQERNAGAAVEALLARVQVDAEVLRDRRQVTLPTDLLVPGDVLVLRAGDVIPADCRVIESRSLLIDESSLTGESFPAEKAPCVVPAETTLSARANALFTGTHVVSGTGQAVVVLTGAATELARDSRSLTQGEVTTSFEKGLARFGRMLVAAMAVLVSLIFLANLLLHRPMVESLLFSLALAVGLTPQLLPAIVAVGLSSGARRMAAEKVIVKRLDAIEDFGTMTVLCTDKTGTLTEGVIALHAALDLQGRPDPRVLRLARLNAGLQRGFANPLDQAILAGADSELDAVCLDELPYDFTRKRLSVLVADPGGTVLITKGAAAQVLQACTTADHLGAVVPIESVRERVQTQIEDLNTSGYRVLALATRLLPGRAEATLDDESRLTLAGLLAFADQPKPGAQQAIADLAALGISVRMITGDSALAAAHLAGRLGMGTCGLTGAELDAMSDEDLAAHAGKADYFAEVEPRHKARIVTALRGSGEAVGFLGDGINDAPALHASDVGISVDTAVDVAKQAAAIVLLDKDLSVICDGVRLGRQTFVNTMKYVRVTISANFGNMLSMAAASVVLPFLPLLPRQILLLNFLTDLPGTAIATDAVDDEQLRSPRAWDLAGIRHFMIAFGLVSSLFDLTTFAVLRLGIGADETVFRTGWFVESAFTELAVMLVLRTWRPFFRSRPGALLLWLSVAVAGVTVGLTYTSLAEPLGLTPLSPQLLSTLLALTGVYVLANEAVKRLPIWRR